jgi:hypothetical protein
VALTAPIGLRWAEGLGVGQSAGVIWFLSKCLAPMRDEVEMRKGFELVAKFAIFDEE